MGTNFYAVLPLKEKTKKSCNKLLNKIVNTFKNATSNNIDEVEAQVDDLKEQLDKLSKETKIHLGKRSAGWSFCWDANELKYYKPSLKSIHKWITNNNATIQNECGENFTWEEFINDEIGYCLYPSKKPMTLEEIDKENTPMWADTIINKFIKVGKPYYKYCTHRTYHEMYPNEQYYSFNQPHPDFKPYAKNGFVDEEFQEFYSKDGLRFVTYTNFS